MAQGAGGEAMQALIKKYILKHLGTANGAGGAGNNCEVPLEALDDAAVINDIVFTTDSHTVKPIFFPGGDIGRLSIAGTVNDVAVMGAKPIALSFGLVLEEGFPEADLEKILKSMGETCKEAGVPVITGDTKVVEKGSLDKCIINTSGIGVQSEEMRHNLEIVGKYRKMACRWLVDSNLRPGDKIIVSGSIGDHGVAVLSAREGYGFDTRIVSDAAPMNKVIEKILGVGGIVSIKDPTRGGLANTLNEWAEKSKMQINIREDKVPIKEGVRAACEMLGIDPFQIGNEGKLVIAVVPEMAEKVLEALRSTEHGKDAQIIGEAVAPERHPVVMMETVVGGKRIIEPPIGDPVPRIC